MRTVLAFDIPRRRAFMHLDTVFTQIDTAKYIVHPAILGPLTVYEITPGEKDPTDLRSERVDAPLERILEKYTRTERVQLIHCGGDDMIAAAKGSGVDLCHENEKGIFGDTAERCFKLHSALPAFKGVFDPANFVQCGEDTLIAWELLSPFMKYAQIKDAKEDGKVVPPGAGIGHLPELLPRFAASGIEVLTLEPHLKSFVGLAALEGGDTAHVGGSSFANNREAFDYAVNTLKTLISKT